MAPEALKKYTKCELPGKKHFGELQFPYPDGKYKALRRHLAERAERALGRTCARLHVVLLDAVQQPNERFARRLDVEVALSEHSIVDRQLRHPICCAPSGGCVVALRGPAYY